MPMSAVRRMGAVAFSALTLSLPPAMVAAEEVKLSDSDRKALALTLYQQDLALVSESRQVDLAQGQHSLHLAGISEQIQPETLLIRGPGLQVLNQVFSYGLLSQQALLQANIGKEVQWRQVNPASGEVELSPATLVAAGASVLLESEGQIQSVSPDDVVFAGLPEGLSTRPTLTAQIKSDGVGLSAMDLQYLTGGMGWRVDYLAELSDSGDKLNLSALVTLDNNTQADYRNATLRLVAGDVQQVRPQPLPQADSGVFMRAEMASAQVPAQQASDRYLYELPGQHDLLSQQSRQVPLFSADGVGVTRIYRIDGLVNLPPRLQTPRSQQASLVLSLENQKDSGLGQPLPAGNFRVYEPLPSGGGQLFAGASPIGHTAEGESFEVTLGRAFDVSAESRQTDFERLSKDTGAFEAAEAVTLKNAKDEAVTVEVIGNLPQGWKMLSESASHEKRSATQVVWQIDVPAGGETTLDYRFRVQP